MLHLSRNLRPVLMTWGVFALSSLAACSQERNLEAADSSFPNSDGAELGTGLFQSLALPEGENIVRSVHVGVDNSIYLGADKLYQLDFGKEEWKVVSGEDGPSFPVQIEEVEGKLFVSSGSPGASNSKVFGKLRDDWEVRAGESSSCISGVHWNFEILSNGEIRAVCMYYPLFAIGRGEQFAFEEGPLEARDDGFYPGKIAGTGEIWGAISGQSAYRIDSELRWGSELFEWRSSGDDLDIAGRNFLDIQSAGEDIIAVGTESLVVRISPSGAILEDLPRIVNLNALASDGMTVVAVGDGAIFQYLDSAWSELESPTQDRLIAVSARGNSIVVATEDSIWVNDNR